MSFYNMYIAASAGSGKTYQLVSRFITLLAAQLLASGQVDVSRLMAITFTRKAAGEFKSRILSDLAKAAANPKSADAYWQERIAPTLLSLGIEAEEPEDKAQLFQVILRSCMQQFNKLQLSTIDSLFGRMVKGLCPELGISKVSPIDPIEEKLYRRVALEASYRKSHSENDINQLADYFEESQSNDASLSSPDYSLFNIIQNYHEIYLSSPHAVWGGDPDEMSEEELALFGLKKEELTPCVDEDVYNEAIRQLQLFIKEKCSLLPEPKKVLTGLYNIGEGAYPLEMHHATARVYRQQFIRFLESLCSLTGNLELPAKVRDKSEDVIHYIQWEYFKPYWDICEQEGLTLSNLIQMRNKIQWRSVLKRSKAVADLIAEFEATYGEEVRKSGRMSFSDISHILRDELDAQRLDLLQERLDMQLEHWMLDEFQDTSHEQYHILRNLLESRAQGGDDGSVFMVGDAKQSIYQFRGGDPEVFLRTRRELFGLNAEGASDFSREMPLNKSYRSAQEVLDFANLLFEPEQLQEIAIRSLPKSLLGWKNFHYERHLSGLPHLKGSCVIWKMKKCKGSRNKDIKAMEQNELLYHSLAAQLAEARPQCGENPPSCAILVNKNADGKKIQEALLGLQDSYGFEGPIVLNADKPVGTDSVLGLALMHFFSWLNTPGDLKSLSLLKISPLWARIEQRGGEDAWASLRDDWSQKGCAPLLRDLLKADEVDENQSGFYHTDIDLNGIYDKQSIVSNKFLRTRKKIWLEEAEKFDELGGTLSDWITHMQEITLGEESHGNEIRILTIHKSKGLEFDMVLLPLFTPVQPMVAYNKLKILSRKNKQGDKIAILLPPPLAIAKESNEFYETMVEPLLAAEELAGYCRLYVALTRAKRCTAVFLPPFDAESSEKESFISLFQEIVQHQNIKGFYNDYSPPSRFTAEALHYKDGDTPLAYCAFRLGADIWKKTPEELEPYDESPCSDDHADEKELEDLYIENDFIEDEMIIEELTEQKKDEPAEPEKDLITNNELHESTSPLYLPYPRDYNFTSLPRSTPSALDRDREVEVGENYSQHILPLSESTGAQFGTSVHQLLQGVTWLHLGLPDWSDAEPRARDTVLRALASPDWQAYFTMPVGEQQLYREQNIEAIVDGQWVSGQIDRMIVHYGKGHDHAPTQIQLIDFKTDARSSKKACIDHYRPQMNAYRHMLSLAYGISPELIHATLLHCPAEGQPEAWNVIL